MANAMIGSMTSGTSSPGNPQDGVPIGGKTGTSPDADHQDWIMGTTTKTGTAVWTGNITGKSRASYTNPITHSNYVHHVALHRS